MAKQTGIEWADSTFNPWMGCTKVSPACDNCYAQNLMEHRMHKAVWGAGQPRVRTSVENWNLPLRWNREPFAGCNECGWRGAPVKRGANHHCGHCDAVNLSPARRRVFCASLADVFDNEVDPAWRADLFKLIAATPNLDWLLLTKRIGNVMKMVNGVADMQRLGSHAGHLMAHRWRNGSPPPSVWLGSTVVNQEEADRDIPKLLAVPAAKRFLSIEPMLGSIDLGLCDCDHGSVPGAGGVGGVTCQKCNGYGGRMLDWIIVGGESGPGARPLHPDWVRSVRDQCEAAGVPFMFKQWGDFDLSYDRDRDDPDCRRCDSVSKAPGRWINLAGGHGVNGERVHYAKHVDKKSAGRLLDARRHDGVPA